MKARSSPFTNVCRLQVFPPSVLCPRGFPDPPAAPARTAGRVALYMRLEPQSSGTLTLSFEGTAPYALACPAITFKVLYLFI